MIRDDQHRIACPAPALCPALTGTAVQLNRNPQAGRPAPTSSTFTPSAASPCRVRCGGSSKPRNSERHRPQAVPPWGRWSKIRRGDGRARFQRPAIATSPPSTRRRRGGRKCLARGTAIGALRGQVSMAPRRNGGLWGYAPACCGRLCQSVPSSTLAVRACTSRRTVHRHATRLRYGASTPRLNHVVAISGKERSRSWGVVLARVRAQAGETVTRDAESAISPFESGRPVRPGLS